MWSPNLECGELRVKAVGMAEQQRANHSHTPNMHRSNSSIHITPSFRDTLGLRAGVDQVANVLKG